jgi:hypothetical protein
MRERVSTVQKGAAGLAEEMGRLRGKEEGFLFALVLRCGAILHEALQLDNLSTASSAVQR